MTDTTELVTKFTFDGNLSILKDYNKELGQAILNSKKFKGSGRGAGGAGLGSSGSGGGGTFFAGGSPIGKTGKKTTLLGLTPQTIAKGVAGLAVWSGLKKGMSTAALLGDIQNRKGESVYKMQKMGGVAASVGIDSRTFLHAVEKLNEAAAASTLDYNDVFGRWGINVRQRAATDKDGKVQTGAPKTGIQLLEVMRRLLNEKDKHGNPRLDARQEQYLVSLFPVDQIMYKLLRMNDRDYKAAEAKVAATVSAQGAEDARLLFERGVQAAELGGRIASGVASRTANPLQKAAGKIIDAAGTGEEGVNFLATLAVATLTLAGIVALATPIGRLGGIVNSLLGKLWFASKHVQQGVFRAKGAASAVGVGKTLSGGAPLAGTVEWRTFLLSLGGGTGLAAAIRALVGVFKPWFGKGGLYHKASVRGPDGSKITGKEAAYMEVGYAWKTMMPVVAKIGEWIAALIALLATFAYSLDFLSNISLPSWLATPKNAQGNRDSPLNSFLDWLMPDANAAALNPAFAGFGGTTNQNITFNITSDDPVAVGREVKKVLTREVRDTQSMNNAGGL